MMDIARKAELKNLVLDWTENRGLELYTPGEPLLEEAGSSFVQIRIKGIRFVEIHYMDPYNPAKVVDDLEEALAESKQ